MALAGGRADVSQLTSLLPLSQLAREGHHCLPLEFTDVPSETSLHRGGSNCAKFDTAVQSNRRVACLRACVVLTKKPKNCVWEVTCNVTETQTGRYIDCDSCNSHGDCFSLTKHQKDSVNVSSHVPAAWMLLLSFQRPCAGQYSTGIISLQLHCLS